MLWLGVTTHPTAEWIVRQLYRSLRMGPNAAISHSRSRRRLWRDIQTASSRDGNSRQTDRATIALAKWTLRTADRLGPTVRLGSCRRPFGERHLRHVLLSYMEYYNGARTHLALNKKDGARYRVPFRPSGTFFQRHFSADCTINMFGFNFRQGQCLVCGNERSNAACQRSARTLETPIRSAYDASPSGGILHTLIGEIRTDGCEFAWNKDPALGVICIQSGPRS